MRTVMVGMDPRSIVSGWVCLSSISRHASEVLNLVPLMGEQTPITRNGLTSFTYARYLVPYLCNFEGLAVFMDSDVVVRDDIHKLFDLYDGKSSVMVANKEEKFERPAIMLFNCERCKDLTPDYINDESVVPQNFEWAVDGIGELPDSWHFLCDYDEPTAEEPSLIHYTSGTPAFLECRNVDYAEEWNEEMNQMLSSCSWLELLGRSVHATRVSQRLKWNKHDYLDIA